MRELSIVVTCTGRKTLAQAPGLSVRTLPNDSLTRRADTWLERVHNARASRRPLRDLYKGEAWQRSLDLEARAREAGFSPTTYVASAGVGLRNADEFAPGYAATFATGHADSVAGCDTDARLWWSALCADAGATRLADLPRQPTLLVLSAAYSAPLAADLEAFAATKSEVLVVGGGVPVPGTMQVVADRGLRAELGGSAMSLNQRIAGAWLARLKGRALTAQAAFDEWKVWADMVQHNETWDRRPLTDESVTQAIRSMLESNERLAWSPALRVLRDSGYACEQKRFKRLFVNVTQGL